jgi:hypothetical protein
MNPSEFPLLFNGMEWNLNQMAASCIPLVTTDSTQHLHFSQPFSQVEIEVAKSHIKKLSVKAATGNDRVSYVEICSIPNDEIHKLCQACIDSQDCPEKWLLTILVAILKRGKPADSPADSPESYQLIELFVEVPDTTHCYKNPKLDEGC